MGHHFVVAVPVLMGRHFVVLINARTRISQSSCNCKRNTKKTLYSECAFSVSTLEVLLAKTISALHANLTIIMNRNVNTTVSVPLSVSTLEAFLAKTISALGVDVQYGKQFVASCENKKNSEKRPFVLTHDTTVAVSMAETAVWRRSVKKVHCKASGRAKLIPNSTKAAAAAAVISAVKLAGENDVAAAAAASAAAADVDGFAKIPFDVLVGADGDNSSVRGDSSLEFKELSLEAFEFGPSLVGGASECLCDVNVCSLFCAW
jgi:hypothetical protein